MINALLSPHVPDRPDSQPAVTVLLHINGLWPGLRRGLPLIHYHIAIRMRLAPAIELPFVNLGQRLFQPAQKLEKENHLIVGWSSKAATIVSEFSAYMADGSTIDLIVADSEDDDILARLDDKVRYQGLWPELALLSCWTGGTLTPYLEELKKYYRFFERMIK